MCLVTQSCLTICDPMDCRGLLFAWEFFRQEHGSGLPYPPSGDLPNPRLEPRCPAMQSDSLPSEPPGKPMNTGLVILSLLQGIFLTQESNWGLLHCRQFLYQLSYQGRSNSKIFDGKKQTNKQTNKQKTKNYKKKKKIPSQQTNTHSPWNFI